MRDLCSKIRDNSVGRARDRSSLWVFTQDGRPYVMKDLGILCFDPVFEGLRPSIVSSIELRSCVGNAAVQTVLVCPHV